MLPRGVLVSTATPEGTVGRLEPVVLPSSHSIPGDSVENCDPVACGTHHLRTYRRLWDPVAV